MKRVLTRERLDRIGPISPVGEREDIDDLEPPEPPAVLRTDGSDKNLPEALRPTADSDDGDDLDELSHAAHVRRQIAAADAEAEERLRAERWRELEEKHGRGAPVPARLLDEGRIIYRGLKGKNDA